MLYTNDMAKDFTVKWRRNVIYEGEKTIWADSLEEAQRYINEDLVDIEVNEENHFVSHETIAINEFSCGHNPLP